MFAERFSIYCPSSELAAASAFQPLAASAARAASSPKPNATS